MVGSAKLKTELMTVCCKPNEKDNLQGIFYTFRMLGPLNLSTVNLSGVSAALGKHQAPNTESKGIKAHWTLDESGLLALSTVELVLERTVSPEELEAEESPLSKLGSTISKLFTGMLGH